MAVLGLQMEKKGKSSENVSTENTVFRLIRFWHGERPVVISAEHRSLELDARVLVRGVRVVLRALFACGEPYCQGAHWYWVFITVQMGDYAENYSVTDELGMRELFSFI